MCDIDASFEYLKKRQYFYICRFEIAAIVEEISKMLVMRGLKNHVLNWKNLADKKRDGPSTKGNS